LPLRGSSSCGNAIVNTADTTSVITINGREYRITARAGAKDPKTGFNWAVAPGNYTVAIKATGAQVQSEALKLSAGETWGVIIDPSGGYLTTQLY
jgi:hypothetical protein